VAPMNVLMHVHDLPSATNMVTSFAADFTPWLISRSSRRSTGLAARRSAVVDDLELKNLVSPPASQFHHVGERY
jgi:hypothetical protein